MTNDLPPLSAWTFETVREIVQRHEREPGLYDYKTVLTPSKMEDRQKSAKHAADHLASIRRTACTHTTNTRTLARAPRLPLHGAYWRV